MTNRDDRDPSRAAGAGDAAQRGSLVDAILRRAGKVAGGTLDLAIDAAMDMSTLGNMLGDSRLRDLLVSTASPERLEAMAEAGHFLRDARETAGLSVQELARQLDLSDDSVLKDVESGERILSMELMLRAASLLARHDPIPFFIKFLRSYNPALEARLEQWGVMALPKNYERERRFVNLYRQHDFLRGLSDEEYQRFVDYMDASTQLVVDVMRRERDANTATTATAASPEKPAASKRAAKPGAAETARPRRTAKAATPTRPPNAGKAKTQGASKGAGAAREPASGESTAPRKRPVVRKVKPRNGSA